MPVIRDADAKTLLQISAELSELAAKARSRKLTLDEMQGATFSISNLGGIGGTSFTPLVNRPRSRFSASRAAVWSRCSRTASSSRGMMLPLSLSYDHRAIDGADGARFIRWVAEVFEQPFLLSLQR